MSRHEEVSHEVPYDAVPGAHETLEALRARGRALFLVTRRSQVRLSARLAEARLPETLFTGIFRVEAQPARKPDPRDILDSVADLVEWRGP